MKETAEVFLKDGLVHEIIDWTDNVPTRLTVRCGMPVMPQFGGANLGSAGTLVTCLACVSTAQEPT